jgi:hypothetical protein
VAAGVVGGGSVAFAAGQRRVDVQSSDRSEKATAAHRIASHRRGSELSIEEYSTI